MNYSNRMYRCLYCFLSLPFCLFKRKKPKNKVCAPHHYPFCTMRISPVCIVLSNWFLFSLSLSSRPVFFPSHYTSSGLLIHVVLCWFSHTFVPCPSHRLPLCITSNAHKKKKVFFFFFICYFGILSNCSLARPWNEAKVTINFIPFFSSSFKTWPKKKKEFSGKRKKKNAHIIPECF